MAEAAHRLLLQAKPPLNGHRMLSRSGASQPAGPRTLSSASAGFDAVHWPPIDPHRHPEDERLWLIRTFRSGDLLGTYVARTKMRRAEMLALRRAQRLLRGDGAGGQWIRVADRLLYIVRDRWLLVYQFAIAFLPSRTIELRGGSHGRRLRSCAGDGSNTRRLTPTAIMTDYIFANGTGRSIQTTGMRGG